MERDCIFFPRHLMSINFNPRAPHGARQSQIVKHDQQHYFNPRAPHGARPGKLTFTKTVALISIHALRMERDYIKIINLLRYSHFNPRAPHGARPGRLLAERSINKFQSTRSAWSATSAYVRVTQRQRISIHALRMERDPHTPALLT